MSDIDDQKKQLRTKMLSIRKAVTDASFDADLFLNHAEFSKANVIAAYWPMAGELDIRGLFSKLNNTCLPVVNQKNTPLIFRKWQQGDLLVEGLHKTQQPLNDAEIVLPDLILVPLLAFDKTGGRLGFGGGYYDRTLQGLKAQRVGVGFDEQEVDQVPMDLFDQRLDWIVTPTQVIRCDN